MIRMPDGSYIQPRWKIKRGQHVYNYYGSWSAVHKASRRENGIEIVPIPPELQAMIDNDPECHPPKRRGFFDLMKSIWGK